MPPPHDLYMCILITFFKIVFLLQFAHTYSCVLQIILCPLNWQGTSSTVNHSAPNPYNLIMLEVMSYIF